MTARHEHVVGHFGVFGYEGLEAHRLARILFHLLGHVPVPQGIVAVLYDYGVGVHVEGQGVFYLVVLYPPVRVLVGDVHTAGHTADHLVYLHLVKVRRGAVEHYELGCHQLVHHKAPHVGVVAEEAPGIRKHELLIDYPVFRHGLSKVVQVPHAVVLYEHPLGLCFFRQIVQVSGVYLLRGIYLLYQYVLSAAREP